MFSNIHTNPRDVDIDRIMTQPIDSVCISRDKIYMIVSGKASTNGVLLTDMVDGIWTVDWFLVGPITNTSILRLQESRAHAVHVLKNVPHVLATLWLKGEDYNKIDAKVVKVNEKEIIAETALTRDLVFGTSCT
jgi:L-2-hydroxyglutarate oxidase LhgO